MYNFDKKDKEKGEKRIPLFTRKVKEKMEEPEIEEEIEDSGEVECPECGCKFTPGEEYPE